jgi:hypothetical protein
VTFTYTYGTYLDKHLPNADQNVQSNSQPHDREAHENRGEEEDDSGVELEVLERFKCVCCNEVPRPRHNQIELLTCSVGHTYCTSCALVNTNNICLKCKMRVVEWNTPTESEPLARLLYEDVCNSVLFACYRNCGQRFKGYHDILNHDRICLHGRQVKCPFEYKNINLYTEEMNQHPHLITVSPYRETVGDSPSWTVTIDWLNVEKNMEKTFKHPLYVLYMHDPETYLVKKTLGKDEVYNPLAAMLYLKDFSAETIGGNSSVNFRCNLSVKWCETEPYNVKGLYQKIEISEFKSKGNATVKKNYNIKPIYQRFNYGDGKFKYICRGPPSIIPACVALDTYNLNTFDQSKMIPCAVCGKMCVWHTHLTLTLKNGFETLPNGQNLKRFQNAHSV